MEIIKENIVSKIIIFNCVLLISLCEISGMMVKNIKNIEKDGHHVSFNHFFPLNVEEKFISDKQKIGSCGNCSIESDHHDRLNQRNDLNWYDKCFGQLRSCSVKKDSSENHANPSDCTGSCACVCYTSDLPENQQQIDSLCLDPIYVDVSQQHVITGVRFTTVRNMVKLQIQEGKLQSGGTIARGTNHWVPPSRTCTKVAPIVHNQTYFVFDNITFPPDYVLTGISFRMCIELWEHMDIKVKTIRNCEGNNFIFLTAYGTSFNDILRGYNGNILEGERSGTLSLSGRRDYTKEDMLIPTKAEIHDQQEKRGNFATFRSTKRISNDAVPIIPYISTQDFTAKPTRPLVGIEMIYYGDDHHGGYISPVVYINPALRASS